MSPVLSGDDSNEPNSDNPAWQAYYRWLDARDRGDAIDLTTLTSHLTPAENVQFYELIDGFTKIENSLNLHTLKVLGATKRYKLLNNPKYKPRKGGMGCVYYSQDIELDRFVAYKVSYDPKEKDENRQRFTREARITSTLRYPGIVPIFGLIDDDSGLPAYAMEYIEKGETFRDIVTKDQSNPIVSEELPAVVKQFPLKDRLRQFIAACRIVNHAHQQNVIHGDLSLKNLMLTEEGAVYVVDWGLARRGDEPDLAPRSGTPGYVPPSVEQGQRPKSPQSDVYSLGMILAAFLAGLDDLNRPRIDGSGRAIPRAIRAVINRAITDRIVDRELDRGTGPDIEHSAGHIVRHSQREELYADAGALADDIQRYLDDEAVWADQDEPWSARFLRWSRRHPRTTAYLGAGILSVVISAFAIQSSRAQAAIAQAQVQKAQAMQMVEASRANAARFEARVNQAATQVARCDKAFSKVSDYNIDKIVSTTLPPFRLLLSRLRGKELVAKFDESIQKLQKELVAIDHQNQNKNLQEPLTVAIQGLTDLGRDYPDFQPGKIWLARCQLGLVTLKMGEWATKSPILLAIRANNQLHGRIEHLALIDNSIEVIKGSLDSLPNKFDKNMTREQTLETKNDLLVVLGILHLAAGKFSEATQNFDQVVESNIKGVVPGCEVMGLVSRIAAEIQLENLPWCRESDQNFSYAIQMARYLVSNKDTGPMVLFDAARCLAIASNDKNANEGEREFRAGLAIDNLRRADRAGLFRDTEMVRRLKNDPAFNPIRDRVELLELLKQINASHP